MSKPHLRKDVKRAPITIKLPPALINDLRMIFTLTDGEYNYYTQFIESAINEKFREYSKWIISEEKKWKSQK